MRLLLLIYLGLFCSHSGLGKQADTVGDSLLLCRLTCPSAVMRFQPGLSAQRWCPQHRKSCAVCPKVSGSWRRCTSIITITITTTGCVSFACQFLTERFFHGWNCAAACRMERGTTTTITLPTSTRLEMILLLCARMKYKELYDSLVHVLALPQRRRTPRLAMVCVKIAVEVKLHVDRSLMIVSDFRISETANAEGNRESARSPLP